MGPDINLSMGSITGLVDKLKTFLNRYKVIIFIILNLSLFSYLVWQVGALNNVGPDQTAVEESLNKNGRLKIDQGSVNKITQLQDQNIQVQSLFKTARDNPFQE